jgi:uncharacterized protein (UPF0335 family)
MSDDFKETASLVERVERLEEEIAKLYVKTDHLGHGGLLICEDVRNLREALSMFGKSVEAMAKGASWKH